MTEKRFKVTDNRDNPFLCAWSVTDYADGGIVYYPMISEDMANVMCDLLNGLHEENLKLKIENEKLKQEKREIIQTILDFCNNDYNGHKESFEDLLEEIGWEEGSWLDKDGNIRDFDEVEWND